MTDGNRPVRTRMPGGVGGAGSIPVPTRLAPCDLVVLYSLILRLQYPATLAREICTASDAPSDEVEHLLKKNPELLSTNYLLPTKSL